MSDQSITAIIDKYLQSWVDKGLHMRPGKTEPEMAGTEEPNEEDWEKWYPINSTVTDDEIAEVEKQLGYPLPGSYKTFLKHKHFYELYISEARFSGQEIRHWKHHLTDMAFDGFPRELLIDKGYIPFADWYDWGMLCFDTRSANTNNEYPIIMWDHDRWDEYEPFSDNFHQLLLKLDEESIKNGS